MTKSHFFGNYQLNFSFNNDATFRKYDTSGDDETVINNIITLAKKYQGRTIVTKGLIRYFQQMMNYLKNQIANEINTLKTILTDMNNNNDITYQDEQNNSTGNFLNIISSFTRKRTMMFTLTYDFKLNMGDFDTYNKQSLECLQKVTSNKDTLHALHNSNQYMRTVLLSGEQFQTKWKTTLEQNNTDKNIYNRFDQEFLQDVYKLFLEIYEMVINIYNYKLLLSKSKQKKLNELSKGFNNDNMNPSINLNLNVKQNSSSRN